MSNTVLKHGQLATTSTSLVYTVPSGNSATITTAVFTNETSSQITVYVYLNTSGTDLRLDKVVIPAGAGKAVHSRALLGSLSAGDIIKLAPNNTNAFNYFISGRVDNV